MATEDWDEIMAPWRAMSPETGALVRNGMANIISAELRSRYGEDHGFGISSSDVNHRVYALIKGLPVEKRNTSGILSALVDETHGA